MLSRFYSIKKATKLPTGCWRVYFSFSRCKIVFKEVEYEGWVYYPHPETKLRHLQNPSLLEVIAMGIKDIRYGDEVDVSVNAEEISIES